MVHKALAEAAQKVKAGQRLGTVVLYVNATKSVDDDLLLGRSGSEKIERGEVISSHIIQPLLLSFSLSLSLTISFLCSVFREGVYVPLKRHLIFSHGLPISPLLFNSAMGAMDGARDDVGLGYLTQRPSTADKDKQFWDKGVYSRLFLDEKVNHSSHFPF